MELPVRGGPEEFGHLLWLEVEHLQPGDLAVLDPMYREQPAVTGAAVVIGTAPVVVHVNLVVVGSDEPCMDPACFPPWVAEDPRLQ